MKRTMQKRIAGLLALAGLAVMLLFILRPVIALPTGATETYNSTDNGPDRNPLAMTNNRSTITTLDLNSIQQDQQWKAYVGNVTGVLTLRDSDDYAIYEWPLTGVTITGEVYATRTTAINWLAAKCANDTTIASEETYHNMTSGSIDSLNFTFNYSQHASMQVGATPIANSSCQATYTYINNTAQTQADNNTFTEILLQDEADMIYATFIQDNELGYRNDSTYDFQMIVPESDVKASPTTYYFYTEIGS